MPRQICMTLSKMTPGLGRLIGRRAVRRLWTRTRFAHTMAHTPLSSLVPHLSFSSHHIALVGKYSGASKGPVGPACGRRGWQTRSTWRSVPGRRPMSGPPTGPSRARTHAPGPGMGACQLWGTDSDELPGRQSISCCSYRRRTVAGVDGDGQRHVLVLLQGNGRSLVACCRMHAIAGLTRAWYTHENGPSVCG